MDWAGWAVFGIAATVTLTGIMVAAQLAGLSRMDIPLILGTMFTDKPDRARSIGFLVHVVNGQVFALGYAAAFAILGTSSWWLGALFGAWHGLAALVVIVPLASGAHPRMATDRSGPSLHARRRSSPSSHISRSERSSGRSCRPDRFGTPERGGRLDERGMGEGLWEVPRGLPSRRVDLLGEQAEVGREPAGRLEHVAPLVDPARLRQCPAPPE